MRINKTNFVYFIIICIATVLVFILIKSNTINNKYKTTNMAPNISTPIIGKPFTILIVPGHDTNIGGASYKNLYERDLVVDVADNIATLLNQDPKYKVIIARNKRVWNPIFANYFISEKQAILDFKNQHQVADKLLIASGKEKVITNVGTHTTASQKTAIELYGINKWADENNVDLIIHLHFNSSTLRDPLLPDPYHGFNMFIPDKQRINAPTSRIIAEYIYNELQKEFSPETSGNNYNSLYEDQSLIALGASNTLNKPALLIEYAYLYEKMLQTYKTRQQALEQMAKQTVAGIKDYVYSINNP